MKLSILFVALLVASVYGDCYLHNMVSIFFFYFVCLFVCFWCKKVVV